MVACLLANDSRRGIQSFRWAAARTVAAWPVVDWPSSRPRPCVTAAPRPGRPANTQTLGRKASWLISNDFILKFKNMGPYRRALGLNIYKNKCHIIWIDALGSRLHPMRIEARKDGSSMKRTARINQTGTGDIMHRTRVPLIPAHPMHRAHMRAYACTPCPRLLGCFDCFMVRHVGSPGSTQNP